MTISPDLDRRFRDAALALELVDLGFDVLDSPVGPLFVAASKRGLAAISFDADPQTHLERLSQVAGPRVLRSSKSVDGVRRELDEYFEGRRRAFDVPLDLRGMPEFTLSVLRELAHVPYGETTTSGALATKVGHPRAARAVATVVTRDLTPIVPVRPRARKPQTSRRSSSFVNTRCGSVASRARRSNSFADSATRSSRTETRRVRRSTTSSPATSTSPFVLELRRSKARMRARSSS